MPFRLTEPHPSVPRTNYMPSGRGGAGNYRHVDATKITPPSSATGPASLTPLSESDTHKRPFTSGRGGAGNVHLPSERAIFSFDEELERQRIVDAKVAPVYHIGRGGMGNLFDCRRPSLDSQRNGSASSIMTNDSDASNASSNRSIGGVSMAFRKVSRTFSRS